MIETRLRPDDARLLLVLLGTDPTLNTCSTQLGLAALKMHDLEMTGVRPDRNGGK